MARFFVKHRVAVLRKSRPLTAVIVILLALAWIVLPLRAQAQQMRFIRDAEVEHTIRAYATPMFGAAGLDPSAIDVYLVNDNTLNAFVAGGMNLFLHTGLLRAASGPMQVMGVIAHEAGHIAGGHLASRRKELESTVPAMIASTLLGLAAGVVTGRGDVGIAVARAGQGAAITNLLSYTRSQEGSADQAAVTYMNQAGYSPEGLLAFMEVLEGQEVLLTNNQDPYLRTHPLTGDRIEFLRRAVKESPYTGQDAPTRLRAMHARMVAKLDGFLDAPRKTLRKYEGETTLAARYARAIAHYREPDLDKALEILDGLLAEHPDDPYFHELKGQMLFEHGRVEQALDSYRRAVELRPGEPLIRLALAEAQLQTNDPKLNGPALDNVQRVLNSEGNNAFAWRLAAIAHGRAGNTGMTALSLSEGAMARGDMRTAREQAVRAQKLLEEHSPAWLRAQDIQREAERRLKKREG
ncbi:M48 family peptidase [Ferruginivarius sediminum]|uniref:M48 family peptidase n=2 Tax=Ferruginivarius sediminum TaxID=2661937 RepID=A0A369TCJ7_9PROT|nr:M48 family peptidase [Ferruginivarius sediminum]